MNINNHKYRRLVNRLPEEMKELMEYINFECIILAHNAGSMGWSVDFQIKHINLSLIYDRGSLIIVNGPGHDEKYIYPNDKDMFSVSIKDLANEINKKFK